MLFGVQRDKKSKYLTIRKVNTTAKPRNHGKLCFNQELEQAYSRDPLQISNRHIIRAMTKRFKEALNRLGVDIWVKHNSLLYEFELNHIFTLI